MRLRILIRNRDGTAQWYSAPLGAKAFKRPGLNETYDLTRGETDSLTTRFGTQPLKVFNQNDPNAVGRSKLPELTAEMATLLSDDLVWQIWNYGLSSRNQKPEKARLPWFMLVGLIIIGAVLGVFMWPYLKFW